MVKYTILILTLTLGALAQERSIQTQHYWTLLREQPDNRTLYDRFCTAWLKEQSDEDLQAYFKSQATSQPDSANRLILAFFYERQGQDAEALTVYRQTVTEPTGPTAVFLYHKARAEMRALQFDSAIADLIKARALESTSELNLNTGKLLGTLYLRTHQPDRATEVWTRLLRDNSHDGDLYEDLIELQRVEGLYDQALTTCDRWLATTKDSYQAVMIQLRQAELWQAKSNRTKALEIYTQALSQVEDGSWLENQICSHIERVLTRDSDIQGLQAVIADLVRRYPQRTGLKKRLARLMVQGGDTDAALSLFQQILDVTPGDKANQTDYVQTLVEAERYDQAITLLEQLSARHTDDREMLITLAGLYFKTQQTGRIAVVLTRFLERSDRSENVYLRIGGLLEQYQLADQAATAYRDMIERHEASLTAQLAYGEFLYRTDHHQEALARFADIAAQGDLQMLMRVCNSAATRDHHDLALQWAEVRFEAFSENSAYLSYLCKVAIRLSAFDKAIAWARRQLSLAHTYADMRIAIAQVQAAAYDDGAQRAVIRELETLGQLSIQETCLLSQLLEAQDTPLKADRVIARAVSAYPEIAMQQQILLYRQRQNWSLAAEQMEALIERVGTADPTHIRDLIELYYKSRRYADGITWALRWKQQSPGNTQAWIWHTKLLRDQGKTEEALDLLTQADRLFQGHADILVPLAVAHEYLGQHADAQRLYWRLYEAADEVPAKLRWVIKIGAAGETLGTHQVVMDTFLAQKQAHPTAVLPLLALAELYKQAGRPGERRQVLSEAARLQSDDLSLLFELATVQESLGHWQQAVATLTRAATLDQTKETKLKIAKLHIQHGEQDRGFAMLFDLAGAEAMGAEDALAIARVMVTTKDWGAVVRFLERILPLHPADYRLHYIRALALKEAGQSDDALEAFIDLLSMKEEIPGNTAARFKLPWTQYGVTVDVELILPVEAVELLTVCHWLGRIAPSGPSSSRRPQSSAPLAMPDRVEALAACVTSHIVTLTESHTPSQRQQIRSDLARCGIANAEVLLSMGSMDRRRIRGLNQSGPNMDQLAQMYPNNQAVQAMWILHRIDMGGCSLQEAKRVFDLLETDCPRLALIIGLLCHGPKAIVADLFAKSYAQLARVTDIDYYEVMAIVYALERDARAPAMRASQRRTLENRLLNWFTSPNTTSAARGFMFQRLCNLFASRDDQGPYITLLERVASGQAPATRHRGTPYLNRALIAPFAYPPVYLPGFPREIYQELREQVNTSKVQHLQRQIHTVRDPILRVILAMLAHDHDEVTLRVRTLMEGDHPTLPATCLAASVALEAGKPHEALALLDRARYLPMSASDRVVIDATMLGIAVELEPSRQRASVDLGQKAALRLMAASLSPVQMQELIIAMEGIGLTEPAAQLTRQVARIRPGSRGQSTVDSRVQFAIERFLEKDRQDLALRLILSEMRQTMGTGAPMRIPMSYLHSRNRTYLDMISQYRLQNALLAAADPGSGGDVEALTAYALLCELLDQKKKAIATYERVLTMAPQHAEAHLRLILIDSQRGRRLLSAPTASIGAIGAGFVEHVADQCRRGQLSEVKACINCAVVYLDQVPNRSFQTLAWIDSLASALARGQSFGSQDLYQKVNAGSSGSPRSPRSSRLSGPNRITPLSTQQRRELHTLLCERMVDEPCLAVSGFARLASAAQARGILTASQVPRAHQALADCLPYTKMNQGTKNSARHFPSARDHAKLMCPALYLVRHGQREKELDVLSETFVVPLQRKGMRKQSEYLAALVDVAQAPEDQFFARADQLIARFPQSEYLFWPVIINRERLFGFVIDVYLDRRMDREAMSDYLLDKIREDLAVSKSRHAHILEYWLMGLVQRHRASAKALLETVVTLYDNPTGRFWRLHERFQGHLATLEQKTAPRERTRSIPTRRATQPRRTRR